MLADHLQPGRGQVRHPDARRLGRGFHRPGVDLDHLALNAHRPGLGVDIAPAQREDLPEPQMRPERHQDEGAQVRGHGFGEGLHLLTIEQRALGGCPAPRIRHALRCQVPGLMEAWISRGAGCRAGVVML